MDLEELEYNTACKEFDSLMMKLGYSADVAKLSRSPEMGREIKLSRIKRWIKLLKSISGTGNR